MFDLLGKWTLKIFDSLTQLISCWQPETLPQEFRSGAYRLGCRNEAASYLFRSPYGRF